MPGKYHNEMDEMVHGWTLDGCDEQTGDVQFGRWAGLLIFDDNDRAALAESGPDGRGDWIGAIVYEDSQGFVQVDYYTDRRGLDEDWAAELEIDEDDDVPADWPVQPCDPDAPGVVATCYTCGRSWDDSRVTSMTPAPNARCPFEQFHGTS